MELQIVKAMREIIVWLIDPVLKMYAFVKYYMMDIMWPISQSHFYVSHLCSLQ